MRLMLPENYSSQSNSPQGNFNASEFDFIINQDSPPKKSLIPDGPKQRIIVFVGGVVVLVIILIAAILGVSSNRSNATKELVIVAQKQNEIIRVATIGNSKASTPEAKKLAALASATTTSDQRILLDYLAINNRKVKENELALAKNKNIDNELSSAETNGRFDDVFIKAMAELMIDYQKSLQSNYQTVGDNGKKIVKTSFDNVALILNDKSLGISQTVKQTSNNSQIQ